MIVLVLISAPSGLRGDLTRWLLEVAPGVFVGRVSRRVREHLWRRVRSGLGGGTATLVVHTPAREQRYELFTAGRDRWTPVDVEGVTLIERPAGRPSP